MTSAFGSTMGDESQDLLVSVAGPSRVVFSVPLRDFHLSKSLVIVLFDFQQIFFCNQPSLRAQAAATTSQARRHDVHRHDARNKAPTATSTSVNQGQEPKTLGHPWNFVIVRFLPTQRPRPLGCARLLREAQSDSSRAILGISSTVVRSRRTKSAELGRKSADRVIPTGNCGQNDHAFF